MIREGTILFGIEHFQQGTCGISLVGVSELIDLVEYEDRVFRPCPLYPGHDPPGKGSWPIAGYTYLLIYMEQNDRDKAKGLVSFLKWAYSDGVKYAKELDYIPLPDAVRSQVLAKLARITSSGKPL